MIRLEAVTKVYPSPQGEVRVFENLSLSLERGSQTVIMGASGTGKTTLLHILAGIDRPTSGRVLVFDEEIYGWSVERRAEFRNRKVGMIFQFFHLLKEFTAQENVALPLLIGGTNKRQALARAEELLVRCGLKDRLFHRPSQLSGGEQQRVAIARALSASPELLLLDEPTGNLDWKTARQTVEFIKETIADLALTVLLVTHSQDVASLFPRTLFLRNGALETLSGGGQEGQG